MTPLRATYIGGPTVLLEYAGMRLLTDPTLDSAPADYPTSVYTLHKTQSPALTPSQLGTIDAVLLSHDHHFDNLDRNGRSVLSHAHRIYTTEVGAERLGGGAVGLASWQEVRLAGGASLVATPARHGPEGGDRGPVIGFLLREHAAAAAIYVSGDTVWYEGVAEVGRRFHPRVAFLNLGAARVAVAGPAPLTFTAGRRSRSPAPGRSASSCRSISKGGATSARVASTWNRRLPRRGLPRGSSGCLPGFRPRSRSPRADIAPAPRRRFRSAGGLARISRSGARA